MAPSACEGSRLIKRDTLQKAARQPNLSGPREGKCALSPIHHSLVTHSLTYTQTHTRHLHAG